MTNSASKETRKILKKCSFEILLKFIISVCYRGSLLVIPILWGKVVDYATLKNFDLAYKMIIFTLGLTIIYYVCACLNQVVYYVFYKKLYKLYSKLAYSSFIKNSIHSLSRFKLSEFNNIINNDIDIIVAFFSDLIIKIVQILEFLIIYYYFYTIDIKMFWATVIVSILMIGILLFSNKTNRKLNTKRKSALDKKTTITHEVFNTVKEIKCFYVFKSVNERVKEKCANYLKEHAKFNTFSTVIKNVVLAIIEIARYALAAYGIYLFSIGKMEIGTIIVIYSYYAKITENYNIIGTLTTGIEDTKVSLQRLNKLIEYRNVDKPCDFVDKKDYQGRIKFENVLYGDKKDPILNDVSLLVNPNSIAVITGPTGSGKTGVLDLLMKMNRKHKGNIFIDDVPYEKIDDNTFYNLISLVRKEPNFFDLSIKDNLMLVAGNFKEVRKVCQNIGIDDEIMSLKDGYDTEINNSSAKISLNLKRGIAIARVLLKNSKILMFDEIIDTLEDELQDNVLQILEDLKKDHTIIIISREEKILNIADKIIRLDNNKIKRNTKKALVKVN